MADIRCGEDLWRGDRQRTSSRKDINFYAVAVRKVKNGLFR